MTKPTKPTDWATGAALTAATDITKQTLGWQTLPDNLPGQVGERPNLEMQNFWQLAVHEYIQYLDGIAPVFVAAVDSSAADKLLAAFECSGADDEVTIRAALDDSGSAGVVLLDGEYTFGAGMTLTSTDKIVAKSLAIIGTDLADITYFTMGAGSWVEGVRFKGLQSTFARRAAVMSGFKTVLRNVHFERESIRYQGDEDNAAVVMDATCDSCEFTGTLAALGALRHDGTVGFTLAALLVAIGAKNNYCNIILQGDSIIGTGFDFFTDCSAIELGGIMTESNDLNTGWVDLTLAAPNPPSPPASFAFDSFKYKWNSGNVDIDVGAGWAAGNSSTITFALPSNLLAAIGSNQRGGFFGIPAGLVTSIQTSGSGSWDATPISYIWCEAGIGLRFSTGTATMAVYSTYGSDYKISTMGGASFLISK